MFGLDFARARRPPERGIEQQSESKKEEAEERRDDGEELSASISQECAATLGLMISNDPPAPASAALNRSKDASGI